MMNFHRVYSVSSRGGSYCRPNNKTGRPDWMPLNSPLIVIALLVKLNRKRTNKQTSKMEPSLVARWIGIGKERLLPRVCRAQTRLSLSLSFSLASGSPSCLPYASLVCRTGSGRAAEFCKFAEAAEAGSGTTMAAVDSSADCRLLPAAMLRNKVNADFKQSAARGLRAASWLDSSSYWSSRSRRKNDGHLLSGLLCVAQSIKRPPGNKWLLTVLA